MSLTTQSTKFKLRESGLVSKMFYLLILQLLWMAVSGHSIAKLKTDNSASDVYELIQDKERNTVAFVNPKTDHQPLREIVYYHLIERPNGEPPRLVEGPDFDETVRPFTNSHGFPFLESFEKEPASNEDRLESSLQDLETVDNNTPEEVIYYDEEEIFIPEQEVERQESKALEKPEESTIVEHVENVQDGETSDSEEDNVTSYPVTTPVVEQAVEKKAKHARKLLFDLVKERYYTKNNTQNSSSSSPLERRKREINMDIPEAPKLGPINYDGLPPYLRTLISTEKPVFQARSSFDSSSEDLAEIRKKMETMMDKIKAGDRSEEAEVKPRTYGMNLTEDHGYVWNNLWSKPGIHFNVEASESIEDDQNESPEDKDESEKREEDKDESEKREESKESVAENSSENEKELDKTEEDDGYLENTKEIEEQTLTHKSGEEDNTPEDKGRRRKDKKKETTISELLENDQFWKWLADWTSVYMDVLSENIKELVNEEVSKQMKHHEETHKHDDKPSRDDDKKEPIDKDRETSENKEPSPVDTEDKKEDKMDKDHDKHKTDDEETLKRRKDKEDKDEKKPNSESDNEKEKDEMDNKDPKKDTSKIQAHNLFGSSIGSEKVTNIFVFYPNSDTNKLIQEIEGHADSKIETIGHQNVTVDERINVPDEDKNKVEKDKDISSEKKNDLEKDDPSTKPLEKDSENDKKDSSNEPEDNKPANKDYSVEAEEDNINKDKADTTTETPSSIDDSSTTKEIENTSTDKIDAITTTKKVDSTDSIEKEEDTNTTEAKEESKEEENDSTEITIIDDHVTDKPDDSSKEINDKEQEKSE